MSYEDTQTKKVMEKSGVAVVHFQFWLPICLGTSFDILFTLLMLGVSIPGIVLREGEKAVTLFFSQEMCNTGFLLTLICSPRNIYDIISNMLMTGLQFCLYNPLQNRNFCWQPADILSTFFTKMFSIIYFNVSMCNFLTMTRQTALQRESNCTGFILLL